MCCLHTTSSSYFGNVITLLDFFFFFTVFCPEWTQTNTSITLHAPTFYIWAVSLALQQVAPQCHYFRHYFLGDPLDTCCNPSSQGSVEMGNPGEFSNADRRENGLIWKLLIRRSAVWSPVPQVCTSKCLGQDTEPREQFISLSDEQLATFSSQCVNVTCSVMFFDNCSFFFFSAFTKH